GSWSVWTSLLCLWIRCTCLPRTPRRPAIRSRGKSMKPLVSILIPAFNAEKWLAQTIRSAVAQRWPRKEVVVIVDEGCRDRTLEVARQMASREVLVVTRPRQTAAGARNDAFSLSQGEYIQWLDRPELLAANKVDTQMEEGQHCRNA